MTTERCPSNGSWKSIYHTVFTGDGVLLLMIYDIQHASRCPVLSLRKKIAKSRVWATSRYKSNYRCARRSSSVIRKIKNVLS